MYWPFASISWWRQHFVWHFPKVSICSRPRRLFRTNLKLMINVYWSSGLEHRVRVHVLLRTRVKNSIGARSFYCWLALYSWLQPESVLLRKIYVSDSLGEGSELIPFLRDNSAWDLWLMLGVEARGLHLLPLFIINLLVYLEWSSHVRNSKLAWLILNNVISLQDRNFSILLCILVYVFKIFE